MLRVQSLAYARDQQSIFSGLTFNVDPGTILHIKGANGAGKSSLLRILAGLCSASSGSLHCAVSRLYIGHQMGLHPALSPVQNLLWLMKLRGLASSSMIAAIHHALRALGLEGEAHTSCKALSKGQYQRVGLARLMLDPAKLWILDEPCTGLDAGGIHFLEACYERQLQRGGAIIIASHQDCFGDALQAQVITLVPHQTSFSEWHSGTYIPVFDDLPSLESTPLMLTRKNFLNRPLVSIFGAFWGLLRRDCMIYSQHPADPLAALGFFSLISSLFLILFGFLPSLLVQIGPALIWMAVLLALLMSIESILRSDYQAGALDHLILSKHPLAVLCFSKMLAHMLVVGLPLLLVAPVVALLFHFNPAAVVALALSLLLGIPSITLIASVGAALTLGLERGAWLVMLLILPLLLPLILLGVHAVICAAQGLAWQADILLLSAVFIFSVVAAPLLMAFTLRVSLE